MKETPALLPKGEDSLSPFFLILLSLCPHPPPSLLAFPPSSFLSILRGGFFEKASAVVSLPPDKGSGKTSNSRQTTGCNRSCLWGAKQRNTLQVERVLQRVALAAPPRSRGRGSAPAASRAHAGPSRVRGHSIYKALAVYAAIKTDPQPGEEEQAGGGA